MAHNTTTKPGGRQTWVEVNCELQVLQPALQIAFAITRDAAIGVGPGHKRIDRYDSMIGGVEEVWAVVPRRSNAFGGIQTRANLDRAGVILNGRIQIAALKLFCPFLIVISRGLRCLRENDQTRGQNQNENS